MRDLDELTDLEVLALTLWGEARGESILGRAAVACVIMNRVEADTWYGKSVKEVCLKPWQFSVWNEGDPNRDKMLKLSPYDHALGECTVIATLAMSDALADITNGSTHYHTASIHPDWSEGKRPVFQLGSHVFYNNVD